MPALLDPLHVLQVDMRVDVSLSRSGIVLKFDSKHEPKTREKAWKVAAEWGELLRYQLSHGGMSVYKLVARGKARIANGRCVPKK